MKYVIIVAGVVAFVETALVLLLVAVLARVAPVEALLDTSLGKIRGYQVSCTTTAGGVSLTDGNPTSSLYVWINSLTPVYIGGGTVDSTHGTPFCTDTASCPTAALSIDAKEARCLSSSGTVTAIVLAGTL